jgi:hypothetical protein
MTSERKCTSRDGVAADRLRSMIGFVKLFETARDFTLHYTHRSVLCGGGLEYHHRNPATNKRRRKGNPVSNETVIYGYGTFATLTSE